MKTTVGVLLLGIALALVGWSFFDDGDQHVNYSISVDPEFVDFGSVDEGTKSVTVKIHNNSNKEYEIIDVRRNCACIDFSLQQTALAPNGSVDAKFSWSFLGEQGKTSRTAVFMLKQKDNDSKRTFQVPCTFSATVVPEYVVSSNQVYLSEIGPGSEATINIQRKKDPSVKILGFENNCAAAECEVVNETQLKISVNPEKWVDVNGRLFNVKIHTSNQKRPFVEIQVALLGKG